MNISINDKDKQTVIAFGSNGLPLGGRTESELVELGVLARQSGDPTLISLFTDLPNLDELQKYKTDEALGRKPAPAHVEPVKVPKEFTGTDPKEMRATG